MTTLDKLAEILELPARDWVERAACVDMDHDIFFAERGEQNNFARHICESCPVQFECLDYALRNHINHGVWGGLSERQRRGYRRVRP